MNAKQIKSVMPVQLSKIENGRVLVTATGGTGLWDVRIRYKDGTERLMNEGRFPYTLAQAQLAAANYSEESYQLRLKAK
jgi:hypothetical protein